MAKKADTQNYEIDWIQRDRKVIDGLDHLGIELVSVNLYQAMLPGLTNVTERARYYALYPWIIHRYAQDGAKTRTKAAWRNWIRSIDFTYAVACMAYEHKIGKDLSSSVVGADLASKVVKAAKPLQKIDLHGPSQVSDTGAVPKSGVYFKNSEGGFGQYYRGSLRILGAMHKHGESTWPNVQLSNYAGRKIAESLDHNKAFSKLEDFALAGKATLAELGAIGESIHPNNIERDSEEVSILRKLFLGQDPDLCQGQQPEEFKWRRDSLLLMLHYLREAKTIEERPDTEFRWACATRALPNGKPWKIPKLLENAAQVWGTYQRNDLLNYCLECIFYAALKEVDREPLRPNDLLTTLTDRAMAAVPANSDYQALPALPGKVLKWIAATTSPDSTSSADPWGPRSTWTLAQRLESAVSDDVLAAIPALVARILGRLVSDRGGAVGHPFALLPNGVEMAASHEVHLRQWWNRAQSRSSESTTDFLGELFLEWVIYRHLRVATRKLANQGVSTYKFRPEEGHLLLVAERLPEPTYTSPRVRQGFRIAEDLHFIDRNDGVRQLSKLGRAVLEAHHA
jgi:hypothetical protein